MGLASVAGVLLGVVAAVSRGRVLDQFVMGLSLTGFSMPIFWWGLLLIMVFSVSMHDLAPALALPVSGRMGLEFDIEPRTGLMLIDTALAGDWAAWRSAARHLVLPTVVLATIPLAVIARMTRSSMLEVLNEDYIRTARAKGVPESKVVLVHGLRNALVPVVTVIGLLVGPMLGGAVLTETIFSWPGVGKWLIDAIARRDYPVVQGGILLAACMVIGVNLIVELTYLALNPRLRGK
jgi:dipeptide transport system permease protein